MSMYEQFNTDSTLETRGIVLDYGDFRVTIARAGGANKQFAKVLERKTKPYRRAIQTETMDSDLATQVLQLVYAESVILNWETKVGGKFTKGIESAKGGDLLPFNIENVVKTFDALPDLFTDIQEQAQKVSLFRQEELEADAGN